MNKNYIKLIELKNANPALTFDNEGYEYISHKGHEEAVKEISAILKEEITGFVEFNNFCSSKDHDIIPGQDNFRIRCQTYWDNRFVGVTYFHIQDFKD